MDDANSPDFYTGAPVEATDLRFRDEFLKELWENLASQHVLLSAPRRTGKTSVMEHLRRFPKHDFRVVAINVQDLAHPADVFQSLLDAFNDHHPTFVSEKLAHGWEMVTDTLKRVQEVGWTGFKVALRESDSDWRQNWRRHGTKLLEQIRKQDETVLLIIDELPDMLINVAKKDKEQKTDVLREFLAWWRSQRLPPDGPHPKDDRVRWLVGGSINLKGSLDELGFVDLINDLEDVPLPLLTRKEVGEFVYEMLRSRGVGFDKAIANRVIERLGQPIPLFLQMATQDLYRRWKKSAKYEPLTVSDVDQVFDDMIRSSAAQDKLQHYYSRIHRYYSPPGNVAAYQSLSKLSLSQEGISRQALQQEFDRVITQAGLDIPQHEARQLFNQLMRDLENDFYVMEVAEDRFDFASGVMKA